MTEKITQSIATFSDCSLSNTPVANLVDGLSSLLLVKFLCATLYRMDQHTRLELALSVWKTDVLPLHQCCGMLPVLHGCGSVLDRNPEPGFPTRSAKVSKTFGERLRLHGRTLFLRKKRYTMLLHAMPKRTAWGWDSELDRSDGVIKPQSAPAPIVYRANARS